MHLELFQKFQIFYWSVNSRLPRNKPMYIFYLMTHFYDSLEDNLMHYLMIKLMARLGDTVVDKVAHVILLTPFVTPLSPWCHIKYVTS